MATKVGFQLESSLASKHLTDAEFIKGGYLVIDSLSKITPGSADYLPVAEGSNDGVIVTGSLCYCQEDSKFYQYTGTAWEEKEFGVNTNATESTSGLMSQEDKQKLDGIESGANKTIVDDTLSDTSTNPVQNKVIKAELDKKSTFSGNYNDLTNKPTIPTVNNATLTIRKNGTNVATFTANSASDTTADITVPTKVSELDNDSGFKTTDTNQTIKTASVSFDADDVVEFKPGVNISIVGNQEDKTITINATDTTYEEATEDNAGLMSAADKANLDTIVASFNSEDGNTTIDTVKEVLKAFENAPEGTNIANALAGKSKVGHTHDVDTKDVAPQGHTHTVTVSGTTGNNSGSAVTVATGAVSDSGTGATVVTGASGTATALTGVKATGNDTFIKTINAGSGSLTSDGTKSTDGIEYVESVTHTAASLTGTKTFNTDAIKDVTLSASTTSTDGPTYIESISGGSGSLKSYDAASNGTVKTESGRVPYIADVVHNAATLTGDTTFVKAQGTFNAGSFPVLNVTNGVLELTAGTLPSLGAATTGTVGISGGSINKTTYYLDHAHTAASGTTKYLKKTLTSASTGTVGISSGSITPTTKYLHHTHTGASVGTTNTAITGVSADGTATVVTGVATGKLVTTTAAPNTHTHSYGSTTALATGTNSGDAVKAVTAVKPSSN
jgi:hypothetical protein